MVHSCLDQTMTSPDMNGRFGNDLFRPLRGLVGRCGRGPTAYAVGYGLTPALRAGRTSSLNRHSCVGTVQFG